jgi:hypothetical protein
MTPYFPRHTVEWPKLEEPKAFQRFTQSLIEMAIITGVLFRLYRALAMTTGPASNWVYLAVAFGIGAAFIFGMATLHLGNFTLRKWMWRAPLFGAVEAGAEALTSLMLILVRREPIGSEHASLSDWPAMAVTTLVWRVGAVIVFALLLAGVVQFVRYMLLRRENRVHTALAVHDEMVKQSADSHQ